MDKLTKRALKLSLRQQNQNAPSNFINCACVIHGDAYSWDYVDRLYSMLDRHLSSNIIMHVYTEATRSVPSHMVKHVLEDWGITGPRKSWWYKMQMFNSQHHSGPLLYCDLDLVIVNNIDWITQKSLDSFWSVRDFKYLWKSAVYEVNSSVMWWDTSKYDWIWKRFKKENLSQIFAQFHGDQNFIHAQLTDQQRRYFDTDKIRSWRWQCLDGGYDFRKKRYASPGTGTRIDPQTSMLIFHGKPKPGDIQDNLIVEHWK